jgi:hypothetical protein
MNSHDTNLINNIKHTCRCAIDSDLNVIVKSFKKCVYGGYVTQMKFGSSTIHWKFKRSTNRNKSLQSLRNDGYTIVENIGLDENNYKL